MESIFIFIGTFACRVSTSSRARKAVDTQRESNRRSDIFSRKISLYRRLLYTYKTIMNREGLIQIPEPKISRFLFSDVRMAWFWFLVRLFVGWEWLVGAWSKLADPAWMGSEAGTALQRSIVQFVSSKNIAWWYVSFLYNVVMRYPILFSYLIVYSEFALGILLVVGAFTGITAFAGAFLSLNYLFLGVAGINPLLFVAELLLMLAWRNAGWWGIDRLLLPGLGVPWQPGTFFKGKS
jgi:thiosulfate dehydrogenase [quinone] large subunit